MSQIELKFTKVARVGRASVVKWGLNLSMRWLGSGGDDGGDGTASDDSDCSNGSGSGDGGDGGC